MPELPEVEQIRRTLLPALIGARVRAVELRRAGVIRQAAGGRGRCPRPSPGDLLYGATIIELERHGKQLAIVATPDSTIRREAPPARVLCVQLGMTGRLLIHPEDHGGGPGLPKHAHCTWTLVKRNGGASTTRLVFEDARRFGGLTPFASLAELRAIRWSQLGPDALELDPERFASAPMLRASIRPIKAALLDQTLIAGVGNIYADEALFAAAIHPATRCRRLTRENLIRLGESLRVVLHQAVENGGTTLRDYLDGQGQPGHNGPALAVYGRQDEPCVRCGRSLRGTTIAQRTTVFCAACQGLGRAGSKR